MGKTPPYGEFRIGVDFTAQSLSTLTGTRFPMENLAETIRHIPFFFGLSREDLARIVGKLEEESFAAGQVIVSQGEVGDALYFHTFW